MAEHSPKHRITKSFRKGVHVGWTKKINGAPRWICSAVVAPTGEAADEYYTKNFTELWSEQPAVETPDQLTLEALGSYYIARKKRAGLAPASFDEIVLAVDEFIEMVGGDKTAGELTPIDFAKVRPAWSKRFGPHRLSKYINLIRGMFKWARKDPVRLREPEYGDEFERPTRKQFRLAKAESRQTNGINLFDVDDMKKLLKAATPKMRAMILLGINGGLGNTDVGQLPESLLDLNSGWLDYARGKTGNERRFQLWPETIAALKSAMQFRDKILDCRRKDARPIHPDTEKLVFITRQGRPYIDSIEAGDGGVSQKDRVSADFARLCETAEIKTRGRGFYTLRRTFRTIADETTDQRAAARVMGHYIADIGGVYVQRITDQRLKAITDHVRAHFVSALAVLEQGPTKPAKKVSSSAVAEGKNPKPKHSRGRKLQRSHATSATRGGVDSH